MTAEKITQVDSVSLDGQTPNVLDNAAPDVPDEIRTEITEYAHTHGMRACERRYRCSRVALLAVIAKLPIKRGTAAWLRERSAALREKAA